MARRRQDTYGFDPAAPNVVHVGFPTKPLPDIISMFIGKLDPNSALPGGRGWEAYDEAKVADAKALGVPVTINVRVRPR